MKQSVLKLTLCCLAIVALVYIGIIATLPTPTPSPVVEEPLVASSTSSSSMDLFSGATPNTLGQKHAVELTYHSQIAMDFAPVIERVNVGPISLTDEELAQFCYWDCFDFIPTTDPAFGNQNVIPPDIDFDKEYVVISYGRKINSFAYYGKKMPWDAVEVKGFATFDAEYFPQTAFIYTYSSPMVWLDSIVGIYYDLDEIYCIEPE